MKRISVLCAALLLLLLIFFTLYGNRIYEYITPKVKVRVIQATVTYGGSEYVTIPREALTEDGSVYIVTSEQGFSRTLYYVHKDKVSFVELPEIDQSSVYVSSGVRRGDRIVVEPEENLSLEDGDRVIVE